MSTHGVVKVLLIGALVVGVGYLILKLLTVADGRGWLLGGGSSTKSMSGMFGPLEDLFAPTRAESRQELQRLELIGQQAPAPGDPPEFGSGRFEARLHIEKAPTAAIADDSSATRLNPDLIADPNLAGGVDSGIDPPKV